jgi:hypothetical protein
MKKRLNTDQIQSELRGESAFFPGYKGNGSTPNRTPEESKPATSPTPQEQIAPTNRSGGEHEKMSTNPQTGKPTTPSPTLGLFEKPEKYTTHLEPSMVKQLKLFAVEKDMKDYQVIKNALLLYFKHNK